MADENDDIRLLIDDFERSIYRNEIENNLRDLEHQNNINARKIEEIQARLNDAIAKEKLKASNSNKCQSGDPNAICNIIGLSDSFDGATKDADKLTQQLKNGEISSEQYKSEMESIMDALPLDERQRFGMFLEQDRFIEAFSDLDNLFSSIPGFEKVGDFFENGQVALKYFQSYAASGGEGAMRTLVESLSENFLERAMGFGIVYPAAIFGLGLSPWLALPLATYIPNSFLNYLKQRDAEYIQNNQTNDEDY